MSKLYNRMKGAIHRNIYSRQTYYDPELYNEEEEEKIDSPEQLDESESDNDDRIRSVRNDDPPQSTPLRGQARERAPIDEDPLPTPVNPPNTEIPTVPNAIPPILSPNTNINPPINTNTIPIPTPPAPTALPIQDPSSHPPINPNQPLLPSINQAPQPSVRATLSSLKNRKRRPFIINPNSQLVGFPRSESFQPTWLAKPAFTPRQQTQPPFPTRVHPPQANISNLGFDYPIENAFINRNVSRSTTMKINEAVEHNRFNNAHYTHRDAYKPKTQYIAIGSNQHLECRLVDDDAPQTGVRYIHEIDYPRAQNLNNIELLIDNSSQLNYFPTPIYHFTAHALPNDPMRYY